MKKRSIALALCCSLVASPVWAKMFVGAPYPFLGPMAAIGLVELAGELKAIPDVEVATYLHQSWKALVDDINRQPKGTHILIVGYSLGANNAILVANNTSYVDSIVALQPSMLTSQESSTGKVGKIIEIDNPNPWMTFGGMGSQKLDAPNIEYIVNNDTHPGAQFNGQFRSVVNESRGWPHKTVCKRHRRRWPGHLRWPSCRHRRKLSRPRWHSLMRTRRNTSQNPHRRFLRRQDLSRQGSSKNRRPFLLMCRSRNQFLPMRRSRSQFLLMRF